MENKQKKENTKLDSDELESEESEETGESDEKIDDKSPDMYNFNTDKISEQDIITTSQKSKDHFFLGSQQKQVTVDDDFDQLEDETQYNKLLPNVPENSEIVISS